MGFGPEVTEGFGDIFDLGQPQQADGKVAQASHHLRSFPFSDWPTVLVKGHVPDVVGTVFNGPLTSNVRKHLFRGSLLDRKACQTQDRLRMNFSRLQTPLPESIIMQRSGCSVSMSSVIRITKRRIRIPSFRSYPKEMRCSPRSLPPTLHRKSGDLSSALPLHLRSWIASVSMGGLLPSKGGPIGY